MIASPRLFKREFTKFYHEVKTSLENYYTEPEEMYSLTDKNQGDIESILNSCEGFGSRKYGNLPEAFWKASYVAIMSATGHILINGNKRLSLILLYFYLFHYKYEILFEEDFYPDIISLIIKDLHSSDKEEKEKKRYNYIKAFTFELIERSIPLTMESEKNFLDIVKNNLKNNFAVRT